MKLTLEQKRIKIAEACGWTLFSDGWARPDTQFYADGRPVPLDEITSFTEAGLPDYFSDLNAMHEAEQRWLGNVEKLRMDGPFYLEWRNYRSRLADNISATATQRAEAFGLTLNLWNEND